MTPHQKQIQELASRCQSKERMEERNKFLFETWRKLRKYNMQSTGNLKLDEEIVSKFGTWERGFALREYKSKEE